MYTRASASDYDDFKAKGWTTEELIPLMKKHETYQRSCNNNCAFTMPEQADDLGGIFMDLRDRSKSPSETIRILLCKTSSEQASRKLQDWVGFNNLCSGAEQWLKWINRDTGRRSDSAHAYIHSTRAVHQNLHLQCNTKVDKIIMENGVAVGVKTVPTKPLHPSSIIDTSYPKQQQSRTFRARKQIIVSGGTLSSPLILQRSGIGDPKKLQKIGVKPIVDLPGVGLNFQDHYLTFSVFRAKPDTESFDDFARGDPAVQKAVFDEWNLKGTGPLATNGIEAGVKIRPTEAELKEMDSWPTPQFRSGWDSYFKNKPDKPVMHYSVIAGWFGDHMLMPPGKFFTMFHFLEYPFSRGETHIVSPDPYEAPDFDAGFMNDHRDMAPMVWGYIKSRETARRMDAYAGEVQNMHPFYAWNSPARAKDMDLATTNAYALPGNVTANIQHGSWSQQIESGKPPKPNMINSNCQATYDDLQYSKQDIEQVEEWVKRHVETTWHSLGTCSMAPKEGNEIVKHGVLDERLNVHGVKNLKVADLSICPDNVGCNTYSTALLIGEKAAMLTAEDLGYSGRDLDMKVPNYHAPGELSGIATSRL
ncbi:Alcohol oxidase [Lachnellula occidentalis]|uniref:Alcohol oxidase n=1 Tax=Lachnellula occidentalis TaxID=215460 RepID=A0A8H8U9K3_9HELO|nr:Alcohol oxidase [Lachnellula occidentalis]